MKFNLISYNFLGSTHGFEFGDPTTLIGGQEIYTYDLASYLLRSGHDVTIITRGPKGETLSHKEIRVKRIRLPFNSDHAVAFNFFFKKAIDKDADIKHLMLYLNSFPSCGRTTTGSYHGVTWDDPEMPFYKKRVLMFLNDFAVRKLDRIAACDTVLLKYAQLKYPKLTDKIFYIPNYVRTDLFRPGISISESLKRKFEGKRILLCPRNLTKARGVDLAFEAFRTISNYYPDLVLVFVGDGRLREWIKASSEKYGLSDKVYIEGHKDHFTEIPSYYAAADIVLIPSRCSEGESLACLEAQAMCKPVVATDSGGLTDIAIHEYNGIVVKPNVASLTKGIMRLIDDTKLRGEITRNGLELIRSRHTYEKWCDNYKSFFEI
jgi:glycosyltransferase involved in cell wall biosynthesis